MVRKLAISAIAFSGFCFGFGGVVTDPVSYTYYVQQLEQAMNQIKLAEDQIKTATDTYDEITSVDERLTGNLARAQKNLKKIKDMQDLSLKDMRKSLMYAKNALEEVGEIPEYQESVSEEIDSIFGEENQSKNVWVSVEAQKRAQKQAAFKQAIIDSEVAHGKVNLQLEELEQLASATNESDTLKDSTDVTNTILLSILDGQQEVVKQLANISRNLSLAEYDGAESKKPEAVHIVDGKDLTNPNDWKVKSKKPKTLAECGVFESNCYQDSIFKDAWN